ncbi:MAG TPA: 1-deoxy-D-xylulose-5-phosphate synthase [Negativicutes bacterium]|nr:1-deoxy-D-xylulose-5-phosphate synthase [Negativicutes bacterium]
MSSLLSRVNSPKDLKSMSTAELESLAEEIREFILHNVGATGGHLAPSLGVVELTLALHSILNAPYDKVVWDVGHQAYVHKILTGRKDAFHTLRQYQGISGFPRREESAYDAFGVGHASTSISGALGMAAARDVMGEKYTVAAVIGDGSLTGGQAFEALNQAGHIKANLMVILNDNEMSIAKNVGGMAHYLSKLRTTPTYSRVKNDIDYLLRRIPAIGDSVAKTAERLKDSLRYLLVAGGFFEELGLTYVGPINGHDIATLQSVLLNVKKMQGPVLVHVITQKGKGYGPAEQSADKYHGIGPFCVETGSVLKCSSTPTYTGVFGQTLLELARQDPKIVAITAAMPEGTGLKAFAQQYPKRFFDVGIAEAHAVTFAAGMATQGLKPVVAVYSSFLQRGYDQIFHDVCLQKLPVVFAIDRAGIVGEDGPTHHGVFDFAYLRHIPGMTLMAPRHENELRHMLKTAVEFNGPVALRYPRGEGAGVVLDKELICLKTGQAEMLSQGKDVALLGIGDRVNAALQAADILQKQGVHATVINARFVKPLDEGMLRKVCREIGMLVTIEDHVLQGGFGSAVGEYLHTHGWGNVKLLQLGLPDQFVEHGPRKLLLDKYGLSAEKIAEQTLHFIREHGVYRRNAKIIN